MDNLEIITKSMNVVKTLMTADKQLETAELKVKLAEVYGNLAEIKNQMTDLKQEIIKLKSNLDGTDTVSKLRKAFKLEERSGYLILTEEIEGYKPGKYCNGCFQKNNQPINLIKFGFQLKCPSCEITFNNPDAKMPSPQIIKQNPSWFDTRF